MKDQLFESWRSLINRSQVAYLTYLKSKTYMSANKIFKANSRLYVVTELLLESNYEKYKELETLIHHLDDWFLHYSIHENSIKPNLLDDFVFESVTGSISYPSSIIKKFI